MHCGCFEIRHPRRAKCIRVYVDLTSIASSPLDRCNTRCEFVWRYHRKFSPVRVPNVMMEHGDKERLRLAAGGDRAAFAELVHTHHRTVIHFAQRFLGFSDRDAAEDLAQDVFLAAWKDARSFRGQCQVLTWLLRITKNACLNQRRAGRLRRTAPLEDDGMTAHSASQQDQPESRSKEGELAQEVSRVVAALPVNQRAAILLRYFHEFSYAEIAEVLETSVSGVESLLFRARKSLGAKLAGENEIGPQVSAVQGVGNCRINDLP